MTERQKNGAQDPLQAEEKAAESAKNTPSPDESAEKTTAPRKKTATKARTGGKPEENPETAGAFAADTAADTAADGAKTTHADERKTLHPDGAEVSHSAETLHPEEEILPTTERKEERMISKKELLKETGISYGQLYRWKREGLIPEDWFHKTSAPTGQETFFKAEQILPRIQKILQLKDDFSIEELRRAFAATAGEEEVEARALYALKELDTAIVNALAATEKISAERAAYINAFSKGKNRYGVDLRLLTHFPLPEEGGADTVYFVERGANRSVIVAKGEIALSEDLAVVGRLGLAEEKAEVLSALARNR